MRIGLCGELLDGGKEEVHWPKNGRKLMFKRASDRSDGVMLRTDWEYHTRAASGRKCHSPSEDTHSMHRTRLFFSTITLACLVILIPGFATAESDKVKSALEDFKVMMETLGAAQLQGSDLYFGSDKADHSITDAVVAKDGGAATLFAKSGENFVSVASTVRKEDGTIAVGTTLDVKSPAYPKLSAGEPYYGEATVFGKAYDAGYEPLKDASGAVIGAYFVGYPK